jgi:uncharacterized membrane protein YebE (DUF533 family)
MVDSQAAPKVMSTWIGALTQGGVLMSDAEAGKTVASLFIGEDAVERLRKHFAEAPPQVVRRERRAAVEVCIWMACADRKVTGEERQLVIDIVKGSGLPADDRAELAGALDDLPSLADVEQRIQCPELRELLLGLAWELALADGHLHRQEQAFLDGLVKRFAVDPTRAARIVSNVQAATG